VLSRYMRLLPLAALRRDREHQLQYFRARKTVILKYIYRMMSCKCVCVTKRISVSSYIAQKPFWRKIYSYQESKSEKSGENKLRSLNCCLAESVLLGFLLKSTLIASIKDLQSVYNFASAQKCIQFNFKLHAT
jgi:hypothetical protein